MKVFYITILLVIQVFFGFGCFSFFGHYPGAYFNKKIPDGWKASRCVLASFDLSCNSRRLQRKRTPKNLIILALSGGGSRASYFATRVMQKLQEMNILNETDAITSVSGGSLPAAHYGLRGYKYWKDKPDQVRKVMKLPYWTKFRRRLLWCPLNWLRLSCTNYDRGDILAGVLEGKLFSALGFYGKGLYFKDLKPDGPNIIINATDATFYSDPRQKPQKNEDFLFTFTKEYFISHLGSNIESYPVTQAVTASASFPPIFQYRTLRRFAQPDRKNLKKARFIHLFDGGIIDNMGLMTVKKLIETNRYNFEGGTVTVILVDADISYTGLAESNHKGVSPSTILGVMDDVVNATDRMMYPRRRRQLKRFKEYCNSLTQMKCNFIEINFERARDAKSSNKKSREFER